MFLCTLLGKIFLRAIFISCLKDKYFVKIWKFFSGVDSAVSGMMERELPGCLIGQIYHTAEQIYHKYWTNISHGGTSDLLFGSSSLPFHSSNPNLDLLVSRKATMTNQTYLDPLQIKMMTMMVDSGLGLNVMLVLDLVWDLERIGFIFPWMLEHSQMEKRADTATISVLFFSDKPC